VVSRTVKAVGQARLDSAARLALRDLAGDLSWLWHERRPVPRPLAADLRRL
jgi:hypothetical protein